MVDSSGIASLRHKPQNKNWSPEEKTSISFQSFSW